MSDFQVGDQVERITSPDTVLFTSRRGKVVGVIRGDRMDVVAIKWEPSSVAMFTPESVDLQFVIRGMDVHTIRKVDQ